MLDEHIGYVSDARRTSLYREAIRAAVRLDDAVADVGCGSGIFGLLSLEQGASHVFAIDSAPILDVAREAFSRAGYAGRFTAIRDVTYRVALPEKVDVLVCDHVGYFGFDYYLFRLMNDARDRFLKPGGRIVPANISIKLAIVESARDWDTAARWQDDVVPEPLHWVNDLSLNSKHAVELGADALLAPPADALFVDFMAGAPEVLKLKASFVTARAGRLHGIAGFFDCELFAGVRMTNAPGAPGAIRRQQAFLPLSHPVDVPEGTRVEVSVTARPDDDLILWDTSLPGLGVKFRQSTLKSQALSVDDHRRSDPLHRPVQTENAIARSTVLTYCDGSRSAAEIIDAVARDHPRLMPSRSELIRFVSRVIEAETR